MIGGPDAGLPIDAGAITDPDAGDADGGDPGRPDAGPPPDAGQEDCDSACPGQCDSNGVCIILCGGDDFEALGGPACPTTVVCPAGFPCRVECGGDSSCGMGVDCSDATSCEIHCTGESSCGGQLTCGAGECQIQCDDNSCRGGIDCHEACFCDVQCSLTSCNPQPVCPMGCDEPGPECRTNGQCSNSC